MSGTITQVPSGTVTLPKGTKLVKSVEQINRGEAETPVQQPGNGVTAQPMNVSVNHSVPAAAADPNYTSLNQRIWDGSGDGYKAYREQLENEMLYQQQTGAGSNPYSDEELKKQLTAAGIDPTLLGSSSQTGGYIKDGGEGQNPGTGENGWSYVEGVDRPVQEGASGADERFMSDGSYAYIQYCKEQYAKAQTSEEKTYWHTEAEKTRARAGYSGGMDGSMYIPLSNVGVQQEKEDLSQQYPGAVIPGSNDSSGNSGSTSDLKSLLEAWQQAALTQSNGQIDYAVQQAVAELQRALEDAQAQFKEQAESVDRDARQAMDNSALYAQMRGDNGGIGQEQYNSIQNTAAQNHLAVQQAQTKLSTDTERQIADLRAQGEFEKADAALEITQTYLAQLISLEQWAAEYDLSVEQFNAQLQQWEAEYQLSLQQIGIAQNQWQQEFDYNKTLNENNQLSSIGAAMLESGIIPNAEQLAAMGMTEEQAQTYITQMQMADQLAAAGGGGNEADETPTMDYAALFEAAKASGYPESFIENRYKDFGFSSKNGLIDAYEGWLEDNQLSDQEISETLDERSFAGLGLGTIHPAEFEAMLQNNIITLEDPGPGYKLIVKWADGWDLEKYRANREKYAPRG